MLRLILILLFSFILISACFAVFLKGQHIWLINRARRRGYDPKNNSPTMFHVRELIIQGEKELAVQMYCQIYQVSRQQAKKEVENLARSIKEKNT